MALSVAYAASKDLAGSLGYKFRLRKVTFDSSYTTGGLALTAADFGLTRLHSVIPCGPAIKSDVTAAYAVAWNAATGKLAAYNQTDPAAAGGAAIPLPEVANAVNLSAYSVHVVAIGQ